MMIETLSPNPHHSHFPQFAEFLCITQRFLCISFADYNFSREWNEMSLFQAAVGDQSGPTSLNRIRHLRHHLETTGIRSIRWWHPITSSNLWASSNQPQSTIGEEAIEEHRELQKHLINWFADWPKEKKSTERRNYFTRNNGYVLKY